MSLEARFEVEVAELSRGWLPPLLVVAQKDGERVVGVVVVDPLDYPDGDATVTLPRSVDWINGTIKVR